MVKKQWLIFLVLIAFVLSCSAAYGANFAIFNQEPTNGTILTNVQVNFKCQLSTESLTSVMIKYKATSWSSWLYTVPQNASSSGTITVSKGLSTENWMWDCVASVLDPATGGIIETKEDTVDYFSVQINTVPRITPAVADQNKSLGTESWVLNLAGNKQDSEDSGSSLVWTVENVDNTFAETSVLADLITFTRKTSSAGSKTYRIKLTDSGGLYAIQDVKINFYSTAVNNAPVCSSIPGQSWTKGESKILNLGSYCSDSDGDSLSYVNTSGVGNIAVSISGSSVTFTSGANWTGSANIKFNASDGKTNTITNEIALTVTEPSSSTDEDEDEEGSTTTTTGTTEEANSTIVVLASPSPSLSKVTMNAGESKKFKVKLKYNVDGVIYSWTLDNKKIENAGSGEYEFKPEKEGTYELKVEAKKNADSDFYMWTITAGAAASASTNLCGNNKTDANETCSNCAKDVKCGQDEECVGEACVKKTKGGFLTGFAVKDAITGKNKWYTVGVAGLIVLLIIVKIIRAKKRQQNLTYFGQKEGFFKRLRRRLAERELRKRQKQKEKIMVNPAKKEEKI